MFQSTLELRRNQKKLKPFQAEDYNLKQKSSFCFDVLSILEK